MKTQGWIAIHRQIEDCFLWKEKPFDRKSAWIDLLLMAGYQDTEILFDGKVLKLKAGERITSMKKLGDKWGWGYKKVKNFLDLLQSQDMITYKTSNRATLINITNYSLYQDKKTVEETQREHKGSAKGALRETNNKDNNINNIYDDDVPAHSVSIYTETLQDVTGKTISSSQIEKFIRSHGADKMDPLIDELRKSEWLKANINFSRINKKFLEKVLSGYYRDYKTAPKKVNAFHNFEGHTSDMTAEEMEARAKRKRAQQLKELE